MKALFRIATLPRIGAIFASVVFSIHANAQAPAQADSAISLAPSEPGTSDSQPLLPDSPDAVLFRDEDPFASGQREGTPWEGVRHYGPLSRVGIGADVNPLGIGIKGAVILTEYLDARLLVNFFNYDTGHFEVDSFSADAKIHFASVGATVDCYPRNSIWRLSGGVLIHNGNNLSMTAEIQPGQGVTINGQNFYSANTNSAAGATPLGGSGTLGLNARQPEFLVSGGFGRFVPRSDRHWSFPSEFGVIFMGAPTITVNPTGWVCTDPKLTQCSSITGPSNPVAAQFNSQLQTEEAKWRRSANNFTVYPMFSYSVVYSFDIK